jgi:hypothetical protein
MLSVVGFTCEKKILFLLLWENIQNMIEITFGNPNCCVWFTGSATTTTVRKRDCLG